MTLNKRALTAIFPVILLGYALTAAIAYQSHRASLIGLDRAKLTQQVYELQSSFATYTSFNAGLLNVIHTSSALLLFIHETDDVYRSEALGVSLQESVHALSSKTVKFVSCAIFQPDHKLAYYYDSSEDPFAGLSPRQFAFAHDAFAGSAMRATGYMKEPGGTSLLLISGFVSGNVAAEPLSSQKGSAFMIQIAVRPTHFDELKAKLEAEYGTKLEISRHPLAADAEISQPFELEPSLFARLTPDPVYLRRPLRHEAVVVAADGLIMSLVSIGMLMLLVRRYITGPIARLDRQVTDVMTGRRDGITTLSGNSEVDRLSTNVETLHTRATGSLQEIQKLYCTDALTGISNRAHFNLLSARLLENVQCAGDAFTLLFIDLDNFKFVNDRYGHEAGDAVLKGVARTIGATLKAVAAACAETEGACARLSGDEFAVLIRSDGRSSHVNDVVKTILASFEGGFRLATQLYPVTPSIGIASVPRDATTVSQLISFADAAMYQAKAMGRNRFAYYSPDLTQKAHRRGSIEEELKALDRDREFSLVYMPVVDRIGKVIACEALLRWVSPSLGVVSPAEFIPIAESTGLFVDIDDWVIDHAMADYGRLVRLFGNEIVLSINISSAQLYSQSIATRIADFASRHALRASHIELELTETFAAGFNEDTRRAVESLRQKGFRIAIDDFGVGYTSVQQIIEYPADTIKLDRMIIDRLATPSNIAGLRSIIAFCHALNMKVTAEGVDTPGKARVLAEARCDGFQGFGISLPLALDALADWQSGLAAGLCPPCDGDRPGLSLEMVLAV